MKPLNQITKEDVLNFIKSIDKKTWIKIGIIAVAAVIVFTFVFLPAWITRLEIRKKLKDLENQKAITQNLLLKQPELIKNKENFYKFSVEVKNKLYQPEETSLLLGVISKLAQDSKVSIVASNPRKFEGKFPPPFDTQYEANAYDFTVEGGFHNLADFVSKIENNPKVLRIQTFLVLPQDKNYEKHTASLSLTVVSTKKAAG